MEEPDLSLPSESLIAGARSPRTLGTCTICTLVLVCKATMERLPNLRQLQLLLQRRLHRQTARMNRLRLQLQRHLSLRLVEVEVTALLSLTFLPTMVERCLLTMSPRKRERSVISSATFSSSLLLGELPTTITSTGRNLLVSSGTDELETTVQNPN